MQLPAGYCSVVDFEEHELGTPAAEGALPAHIADMLRAAAKGVPCDEGGHCGSMPRTAEVRRRALALPGGWHGRSGLAAAALLLSKCPFLPPIA